MDSIDQIAEKSGELFASGYCCAEAVLMAMAEAQGVKSELIPRIATGFCSGIRRGDVCGALSGAVMGINLAFGRDSLKEPRDKDHAAISELMRQFEQKFSAIDCRDLTGCDISTPEGRKAFEANADEIREQCKHYCEEAARIAMAEIRKS